MISIKKYDKRKDDSLNISKLQVCDFKFKVSDILKDIDIDLYNEIQTLEDEIFKKIDTSQHEVILEEERSVGIVSITEPPGTSSITIKFNSPEDAEAMIKLARLIMCNNITYLDHRVSFFIYNKNDPERQNSQYWNMGFLRKFNVTDLEFTFSGLLFMNDTIDKHVKELTIR